MFWADMVPSPANTTLKQGKRIFDGVRMDISDGVDSFAVSDRLVPGSRYSSPLHCVGIRGEVIGEDHFHVFANVLFDEACNRRRFDIFGVEQAKLAVALTNPDDDFLSVPRPLSPLALLPL